MGRVRAWLEERLPAGRHVTESKQAPTKSPTPEPEPSIDHPPLLPSPRPRPLTAVAGDDDKEAAAGVQLRPQPPTCLLFSKMPGDLRLMILNMAFARRKLHMDLVLDGGLIPDDRPSEKTHARIVRRPEYEVSRLAWRWVGCVCHRYDANKMIRKHSDLITSGLPVQILMDLNWVGPHSDYCLWGGNAYCPKEEGAWPGECQVGIMGFLLSCRQA